MKVAVWGSFESKVFTH